MLIGLLISPIISGYLKFIEMEKTKLINCQPDFDLIFSRIANGESVRTILASGNTLMDRSWFYDRIKVDPILTDQYARACEERADKIFEELIDIADNTVHDTDVRGSGSGVVEVPNAEWIQRSKVRIDTRKWMLSKMNPKKYGDKMDVDLSANVTVKQIFKIGDQEIEF